MEISVIIPTFNRAAALTATLETLRAQEGAATLDWEIIVVDNDSTDDTRSATESFASRSGLNVRYLFERAKGNSNARNRGIEESTGEILLFIDDDEFVAPQWLLQMKKAFEDYHPACVGGKVLADKKLRLPAWWDERFTAPLSVLDLGDEVLISTRDHPSITALGTGGNVGFARKALKRNGRFTPSLGKSGRKPGRSEDSEIILRFQWNGEMVVYYPTALVYHSPDVGRFTEDSMSDFFYKYGMRRCHLDLLFPGTGPRIAGIPLWRYRWLLENSLKDCWHMVTGNSREAFYRRMSLYQNWGYSKTILKEGLASLIAAKPEHGPQRSL